MVPLLHVPQMPGACDRMQDFAIGLRRGLIPKPGRWVCLPNQSPKSGRKRFRDVGFRQDTDLRTVIYRPGLLASQGEAPCKDYIPRFRVAGPA